MLKQSTLITLKFVGLENSLIIFEFLVKSRKYCYL